MATFQEALQYAKQNPTSDFASQLRSGIETGKYTDAAKQEGVDLSHVVKPASAAKQEVERKKISGMGMFANTPEAAQARAATSLHGGQNIKDAFNSGKQKAKEGYNEAVGAKNLLQLFEGSIKAGAGAVETTFSPLAAITNPTIGAAVNAIGNKISDIPAVQKFAMSKPGEITSRAVGDVANVNELAGAVAGGINPKAIAGSVSDATSSVAGVASRIGKNAHELLKDSMVEIPNESASAINQTTKNIASSDAKINDLYNRAIKPTVSGKNSAGDITRANSNVVSGIRAIAENKPNLSFTNADGETTTGATPKSVDQLSQGIQQTKSAIFNKYDALAQQAGDKGITVDTPAIAQELQPVIDSQSLAITNPRAVQYAEALQNRLNAAGELDAKTAQDVVQHFNESLKAFYRNPNYENASTASIDALIANKFRKALDDGISSATGEAYQELKNQYGALSSIEKDVAHRATVWGRQNKVGLVNSLANIGSGAELVRGLVTMNPTDIAVSLGIKSIQKWIQYLNNPDVGVSKIFSEIEKSNPSSKESMTGSAEGNIKQEPSPNNALNSPKKQILPKELSASSPKIFRGVKKGQDPLKITGTFSKGLSGVDDIEGAKTYASMQGGKGEIYEFKLKPDAVIKKVEVKDVMAYAKGKVTDADVIYFTFKEGQPASEYMILNPDVISKSTKIQ